MSEHDERHAAEVVAQAWNELETGRLEGLLDDRVRYRSLGVEMVLEGRGEVLAHLERKMELIGLVGEDARIVARLARVRHGGVTRWVALSSQGGVPRSAVFLPSVDEAGLIVSIDVLTDAEVLAAAEPVEAPS